MPKTVIFLSLLFVSVFSFAQNTTKEALQLEIDVVYLASDYLEGRETGLAGEVKAAEYIAYRFESLGLTPKGHEGSWYHTFKFQKSDNPHVKGGEDRTGRNVVAYLDNGADNTVVIGGHYDHLGMGTGGIGSLNAGEPDIHNGADDNASGIAAMLRIAEYLKAGNAKNNNYLFIGFSGEEMGLFGSKNYVNDPTIPLEKINYMINMDMVGRLNEEKVLAVNAVGTSPAWEDALARIDVDGITVKTSNSGIGPSDHTSFYLKDMPVLHFFTGQHKDYHKPSDDAPLVNFEGLMSVSNFIIALVEDLDDAGKLEFTKTKDENQGRTAAKFKVTLGVMPDYVYNGDGMRVDGVLDGRTGAKAGLKDGDIVIQIGDQKVDDIYGYMEGLSKFKVGDKAIVKVKRGDEIIEMEVKF